MEIVREIAIDADPDDVWAALTESARLEEWFANDVVLDPRPGGRGSFRWANGETREADVESVDVGSRLVLRFEDDGIVDLRILPTEEGCIVEVRETAPSWSTALELRALALCSIR
jgi:uncharacterized protein YndB with AHSA1/START domain